MCCKDLDATNSSTHLMAQPLINPVMNWDLAWLKHSPVDLSQQSTWSLVDLVMNL